MKEAEELYRPEGMKEREGYGIQFCSMENITDGLLTLVFSFNLFPQALTHSKLNGKFFQTLMGNFTVNLADT